MVQLVPVDNDPFAATADDTGGRTLRISVTPANSPNLVPVDHDPFAEQPSGIGMNLTAGANEAIYNTLGAPVDVVTWALNKGIGGLNSVAGTGIQPITDPFGGSQSISRGFGLVGVPDPQSIQANSSGEKIARAMGQGAGYMLAPELAVRGAAQAAGTGVNALVSALAGSSTSAADALGNATVGALAGGGGSIAGQLTPEPYRPLAELGGNLLGGGLGALAVNTPRMAAEAGTIGRDYAAPLSTTGQERIAAQSLRDAASDPSAVRGALDAPPSQLVPGSQPTTFQQTGDMGLGGLERIAMTRNPEAFMQRSAEQNAARQSALGSIQPDGSPEAVVNVLRQRLADIDTVTGDALNAARTSARDQTAALGGVGTPEGYGSTLRQMLTDAENATRARERGLWAAVDPDGTLALEATAIREEARKLSAGLPRSAKPMEGEEAGIIGAASNYRDVMPFSEVTALRSRVSTEMRRELSQNGQTPVYARLVRLRGAIENALEGVVAGKAAQEAEAVAAGQMRPEDTLIAKIQGWTESWRAGRVQAEMGLGLAEGAGGYGASGPSAFSSASGTDWTGGRRPGKTARSQGVPGADELTPNFDAAALGRLREANDATKARAQTYGIGVVAEALRRSGQQGPYNMPSAAVPSRFFRPGARGFEDMQALRTAANNPEAMVSIRDYAVSTLRRAAEEADGTLNPSKVATWRRQHADALRALPEIDRMLAGPVEAAETVARLAAERKQALDTYQAGLVGRLIGVSDPADVSRAIGSVFTSQAPVEIMRQLVQEARRTPEAMAGLRKAVADHLSRRVTSYVEAATSGQRRLQADGFQRFVDQNQTTLREVFGPEEMDTLHGIAADIMRSQRSLSAVRIPGQSNTAQDVAAMVANDRNATWFTRLLASAGPGLAGAAVVGPWTGLAAAVGGNVLMNARKAGLQKVDDIIADAMLNPERARLLLMQAGNPRDAAAIGRALSDSYRRATTFPAWNELERDDRPPQNLTPLGPRSDADPSGNQLTQALAAAVAKAGSPQQTNPAVQQLVKALMDRRMVA
ncbi:hypothetical protein LGR54_17865 [Ancylobacter sp. Lp-2]|uniref:hypothetical protein n=1 Tax=Ancylobacter sp. Lp-2 TaxID=2881339 RepID=UPI001E53EDE2|nr:hypothetical protein [Ancylobacter sp. Lp-2]MCB4770479.1 hypothetical protein [Ancylobacter sp. Lp-2]